MSKLHELVQRIEERYSKDVKVGHHDTQHEPLEDVLKGFAVELWSNEYGELFIVADEGDAARLTRQGIGRGAIYTASEVRHVVVTIADSEVVQEVHRWKREFDAIIGDE